MTLILVYFHFSGLAPRAGHNNAPEAIGAVAESPFRLLLKLDDIRDPGISDAVFKTLWTRCDPCKKTMTHRAYLFHRRECPILNAIVDLTGDVPVIDLTQLDD